MLHNRINIVEAGLLKVDLAKGVAEIGDRVLPSTKQESRLLGMIAARQGRPASKVELFKALYATPPKKNTKIIDVLVSHLRNHLETFDQRYPQLGGLIKTANSLGYLMSHFNTEAGRVGPLYAPEQGDAVVEMGVFRINLTQGLADIEGKVLPLNPNENALICQIAAAYPGHLSKAELKAQSQSTGREDAVIEVMIHRMRTKLESFDLSYPRLGYVVQNVRGRGYTLARYPIEAESEMGLGSSKARPAPYRQRWPAVVID